MTPPIIGLTGGIGSGKSTIALEFNKLGIETVDADDVAREVVSANSPTLQLIQDHFGSDIIDEQGGLNRTKLRDIIFSNNDERLWLESITHPAIRALIQQKLAAVGSIYAVLVHPLLFEKGQESLCDAVISISVPGAIQVERVTKRDNQTVAQVRKIMDVQYSQSDRDAKADYIIKNTGKTGALGDKVKHVHIKILETLHEQ
ncbi:dephospho-CoA kinase [Marinomonas mediterranea]|jgi:dephospho-CoA kinase|uniref:Dephospho-CoA kinase n=1 Tax=Marinomonas mediterranea (strain ATCC 700492 / JCM 21426 / NBRC 103028 / MMB-1) TaxID=717774 RepID=F2K3D7_MARM1|nr:dephospho-CoA kinase [Marinomonas mediterranea]ADZ91279.1 Dephospho-CoA kinase [Marinomonas mediterranea MMB-1]WCN13332.1 dephospho-CoA kinase [Marinomonas mediterranea]WCN17400.1 dephospho-CoA kinase [Marinomonas mediterranea MMB-1]